MWLWNEDKMAKASEEKRCYEIRNMKTDNNRKYRGETKCEETCCICTGDDETRACVCAGKHRGIEERLPSSKTND